MKEVAMHKSAKTTKLWGGVHYIAFFREVAR